MGLFDMKVITCEISGDDHKKFQENRENLAKRNFKYSFYFKNKWKTAYILTQVFIHLPEDFAQLVDKLDKIKLGEEK